MGPPDNVCCIREIMKYWPAHHTARKRTLYHIITSPFFDDKTATKNSKNGCDTNCLVFSLQTLPQPSGLPAQITL